LLNHFESLVGKNGIMLSAKKIVFAKQEINFFGMHCSYGEYILGPYISQVPSY